MMRGEPKVEHSRQGIWTVEQVAWIALALLAGGLRLFQLGARPLSEAEAVQALAAYRFVLGGSQAAPAGTLPALFTGNVAAFTLMGSGDAVARWLPVVAGLALVLLPYGLRHHLGRGGALAAGYLLAFSPSAVYLSRSLDSSMVVAACGLGVAVGLINYLDTRRPAPLYLAAVALGLGLCTGPGFLTLFLVFVAFGLALYLGSRFLDRPGGWSSMVEAWSDLRGEGSMLARATVTVVATFGLAATAFVLYPAGIGHAADLIATWAQGFLPQPGGQSFLFPLLLLVRYESLILVLGLVEAGWFLLRGRRDPEWSGQPRSTFPHTAFLTFWAIAAGILIMLAGHRPPGNLILVVVPLALLAGQGTERAWRWVSRHELWPAAGLFAVTALGLLVFFYLQLGFYSHARATNLLRVADLTLYTRSTHLILVSVSLLLLIALCAGVWLWRGRGIVLAGGWLTVLIVLGLLSVQVMWGLNFFRANDPRELMIARATDPDVRELVLQLKALSLERAGDENKLPIAVDATTGPVVEWYLRAFKDQSVVEGLSEPPDTLAAVTLIMDAPPIGESFRGKGFALQTEWDFPRPEPGDWAGWGQKLVSWLLYTDGDQPTVTEEAILWVGNGP